MSLLCQDVFLASHLLVLACLSEDQMDILGLKETRWVSNNEWSWMAWTCAEDDNSALRVALDHKESGKRVRTTKEESGRGDRKDRFKEGKCSKSSEVKRWSANNCRGSGVNTAISANGIIPDKN